MACVRLFRLIECMGLARTLSITFAIPVFAVACGVLLLNESLTFEQTPRPCGERWPACFRHKPLVPHPGATGLLRGLQACQSARTGSLMAQRAAIVLAPWFFDLLP